MGEWGVLVIWLLYPKMDQDSKGTAKPSHASSALTQCRGPTEGTGSQRCGVGSWKHFSSALVQGKPTQTGPDVGWELGEGPSPSSREDVNQLFSRQRARWHMQLHGRTRTVR